MGADVIGMAAHATRFARSAMPAVLCIGLFGMAACNTLPTVDPTADAELNRRLAFWGSALPVRIGVAVVDATGGPPAPGEQAPRRTWAPAAVDGGLLSVRLAGWLDDLEIVELAAPLGGVDDRREAMARAWAGNNDFLLLVEVRQARVAFTGHAPSFPLNLLNWALWVWPAWFVADESYEAVLSLDASLIDLRENAVLAPFPRRFEGRVREALDDFQRGWQFFGILRVPGSLKPENWTRVADALMPAATGRACTDLLVELADASIYPATVPQSTDVLRAIVAGAGRSSDPALPETPAAEDDARAVGAALAADRKGGLQDRVTTLLGAEATRSAVSLACGHGPLVVYLSGRGTVKNGSIYWLGYDAESATPSRTGLCLQDLLDGIDGPAIVIADIGLGRGSRGLPRNNPNPQSLRAPADARHLLVVSTSPGEGALEIDALGRGLFSYHFEEGLEGAADADGDGRVTLLEAVKQAAEASSAVARFEGVRQNVLMLGDREFDPVLRDLR